MSSSDGTRVLYLQRHGKAQPEEPDLDDFERRLLPRGREAVERIGRLLRTNGATPGMIISSAARRTTETAQILAATWEPALPVNYRRELYMGSWQDLLDHIQDVPDEVQELVLVGHNPDLQILSAMLAGNGPPQVLRRLKDNFPTAACAVLSFPDMPWSDIDLSCGYLRAFHEPDRLP